MNHILQTGRPASPPKTAVVRDTIISGLDEAGVRLSLERYGSNALSSRKQPGFLTQYLHNLNDPIIRILLFALVLNIIFLFPDVDWFECGGIAFAVFISSFVSTVSEYSSSRAFTALYNRLGESMYTVLRNGRETQISSDDIVCMDVIRLRPGEIVPADGYLIAGELQADQSSLTGESQPVTVRGDMHFLSHFPTDPLPVPQPGDPHALFRGSAVCAGECTMLVVQVGDKTVYGKLAAELTETQIPSPLKARLHHLAGTISKIGYVSAAVVAFAHLFHSFVMESGMQLSVMLARMQDFSFVWSECLTALTMAISILVVAVPEGLPMMITVVLSANMRKMLKSGVLVRKLVGIETSGSLDVLFTDKTGTLTTGAMTVSAVHTPEETYTSLSSIPATLRHTLKECTLTCGGSRNQTEGGLFRFFFPSGQPEHVSAAVPFDSARKYSGGICGNTGYIQGAAEILLPCCTTWLGKDGKFHPMDERIRLQLTEICRSAAGECGRVLLAGFFDRRDLPLLKSGSLSFLSITFAGLFVLQDEIRPQVPAAVRECRSAGIQVIMITGDNEWTAAAIGKRTGILGENWQILEEEGIPVRPEAELVIKGQFLGRLDDTALTALLPQIRIISRVTPTDKSRLVRLAQASGHVVGMTGDGINDAPALTAADVGFAMGSGTEVARKAGDIVITDDNFVSISKAVLFGRTIFQSIRKFIVFQLIMNLCAVGVSLLGPLFGMESPVTVIQMLWVNIIMDTLGSLAFAGEAPLKEYMQEKPIRRTEPILTGTMVRQILFSAGYGILLSMGFLTSDSLFLQLGKGDMRYFLTGFFALFIFSGICFAFTVRTPRRNLFANLAKNRAFLIIMPAVACIQLLIIYFGGDIFRTTPLDMDTLLWCGLFSLSVLPMDFARKSLMKKTSAK